MLKNMDTNNNGRLEPSEIPEARRPFVQMMAQRLGVNPNGPIDLRALERSTAASSGSSDTRAAIVLPENPLVPYFGEVSMVAVTAATTSTVLGFGQRENTTVVSAQNMQNQRNRRGQQVPQNADIQLQQTMKAARDLLTRNDKNRNGTLDKLNEEWNGLPFDANSADKNKDGRLTLSEMITALGGKPTANLGAARATNISGSFQDRMPEGVPDWFTQMDTDKDGQLSMNEYLTGLAEGKSITDEMINEFKANDANSDGIITIAEAYAFMKRMDEDKLKKDAEAARQAGDTPAPGPNPRGERLQRPKQGQGTSSSPNPPQPTPRPQPQTVRSQQQSAGAPTGRPGRNYQRQRPGNSQSASDGGPQRGN